MYSIGASGGVYAKGIVSAETGNTGPCNNIFTDIFEARVTLGGTLVTS